MLEHREIKDFFGSCLEERKKKDWYNNPILSCPDFFLSSTDLHLNLLSLIKRAEDMLINYEDFRPKELKGDENDFDEKIMDKVAELRGLSVLYDQGYRKAQYIVPQQNTKTPDFKVEGENVPSALAEVTHKGSSYDRDPKLAHIGRGINEAIARGKIPFIWGPKPPPWKIEEVLGKIIREKREQLEAFDPKHEKTHIVVVCFDIDAFLTHHETFNNLEDYLERIAKSLGDKEKMQGEVVLCGHSLFPIFVFTRNALVV